MLLPGGSVAFRYFCMFAFPVRLVDILAVECLVVKLLTLYILLILLAILKHPFITSQLLSFKDLFKVGVFYCWVIV